MRPLCLLIGEETQQDDCPGAPWLVKAQGVDWFLCGSSLGENPGILEAPDCQIVSPASSTHH